MLTLVFRGVAVDDSWDNGLDFDPFIERRNRPFLGVDFAEEYGGPMDERVFPTDDMVGSYQTSMYGLSDTRRGRSVGWVPIVST